MKQNILLFDEIHHFYIIQVLDWDLKQFPRLLSLNLPIYSQTVRRSRTLFGNCYSFQLKAFHLLTILLRFLFSAFV